MFQYFLKVVSTRFVTLKGHTISTHQYSVTQYERDLSTGNKPGPDELGHQNQHGYAGVPGVFVNYEVRCITTARLTRRSRRCWSSTEKLGSRSRTS